ncbi:NAD(P)H-binding protein [Thalassotalea fusca]
MTNGMSSVGIIGCGWLGNALANQLIAHDHVVIGTTRSEDKLQKLSQLKIIAEKLEFPLSGVDIDTLAVFNCNTLVIAITPGIRQGRIDYADNIKTIVGHAQRHGVEHIVLLNSTAIYQGLNGYVDEAATLLLDDPKVALLKQAEQYVENYCGRYSIFRLSGLVGPGRHPGNFFNSNRLLTQPNAFVNLIHQQDVVNSLFEFITQTKPSEIYNASSSMEVSKGHFYNMAAYALGKEASLYDNEPSKESGKLIVTDKLHANLEMPFKFDDIVSWMMTNKA